MEEKDRQIDPLQPLVSVHPQAMSFNNSTAAASVAAAADGVLFDGQGDDADQVLFEDDDDLAAVGEYTGSEI